MQIPVRAAAPKLAVNQLITLTHTHTVCHGDTHTQARTHRSNLTLQTDQLFSHRFEDKFFKAAVKLQRLLFNFTFFLLFGFVISPPLP